MTVSEPSRDGRKQHLPALRQQPDVSISGYDDSLHDAGAIADRAYRPRVFADYQRKKSEATRQAQQSDLKLFSRYLEACGLSRSPEALYNDPHAWRGMNYALLEGFRMWLYYEQPPQQDGTRHGFAIRSVKRRISTIRVYCKLAYKSGILTDEEYNRIQLVEIDSHSAGVNIDQERRQMKITPRLVERKNANTVVKRQQASRLKKTTIANESARAHDQLLEERDELLMCLLIEHGLRVSEIVNLDASSIDLQENTISVKRSKTYSQDVLRLMSGTRAAAARYLPLLEAHRNTLPVVDGDDILHEPLFYGYEGRRITRFGIYNRVRELGELVGIKNLSPHVLRNYWVQDAFHHPANSLDMIQQYGGWKSAIMPLYYAQQHRPLTEGFQVSE